MKVVFRVDASNRMGIGHLMRCLTLAEVLRGRGAQIRFICREHAGNLIGYLGQKAIPLAILPALDSGKPIHAEENYAVWLGASQEEDAIQTIEALEGEIPDWVVVDHYGLDAEWERRLRPHANQLMVIDDLANRSHDCNVLLDQNYSLENEQRYARIVPAACKLLVGPRFALLRPEYALHHNRLRECNGMVSKVFVYFGGTDPDNITGMALAALSCDKLRHLTVTVVVGVNSPHMTAVCEQVHQRPHTELHTSRPHLADLMSESDLAIGAGGTTTWERMCLGLPTIVVSISDNQIPSCKSLSKAQLVNYAGHWTSISAGHLKRQILSLCGDPQRLVGQRLQNQLLVDGLGARKVVEIIDPSAADSLRLRPAREEDIATYFNWANDPQVRRNAVHASLIPWAIHEAWFANKLRDANSHLFVLEATGLPIGQIRFDREGNEARIDYSLDSTVRGRGWGKTLVALGSDLMQSIHPLRLRAEVKVENFFSSSVFLRAGFTEAVAASPGFKSFYRNSIVSLTSIKNRST